MPRTILVADDNLTIQRMASEMLTREGVEVVTVANGMAALKKLSDTKPLVILADVDMPGKDGYEVCEFVKSTPELHYVRVLLAVSDSDPYDQERGVRVRADGIVRKPFEREHLVSMVTECLKQAESLCPVSDESTPQFPPVPETAASQTDDMAAGETIASPPLNPLEPHDGFGAGSGDESSQFSASLVSFEPVDEAAARESAPAPEPSWPNSQFSSAVDFSEPQHSESEDPNAGQGFEPFGSPSETWASSVVVPASHEGEPQHQPDSLAAPQEEPAAGLRSFGMNPDPDSHFGVTRGENQGAAPGGESRFERLVESLLVEGPPACPTASPLKNVSQDREAAAADSGPPEAIEWDAIERASEGGTLLDPAAVAEIVRKVIAKMAPPALPSGALHELETAITAELLSELNLN